MNDDTLATLRRRLATQYLTTPAPVSAAELVRALTAVQSQDYPGAKWALGQRLRGATDAAIEQAFTDGEIIRTHVMRPTWHFVHPDDIRWLLALTAPSVSARMAPYNKHLELDARTFARSNDALARALDGGQFLTRTELGAALTRARIPAAKGQRLAHLMMRAELDAVVCSGPRRGKQFTYALMDERVPARAVPDRDECLAMLAHRYFATRGPASAHDFSWWSGLSVTDARRAVAMIERDLTRATHKDRDVWFADGALPRAKPVAHVLPNYDEYFIGYKDRGAIGGRVRGVKLVTGGDALIGHVIAINGELVGGWKRVESRAGTNVALRIIARVTAAERGLVDAAVGRFERFVGG